MGITPGIPRGGVTFDQLNAALAPYLTAAIAASTYLTQANAANTYVPRTGGAFTGNLVVQDLVIGGVDGPRLNRSGATIRARSNDGLSDAPFSAGAITAGNDGNGVSLYVTSGIRKNAGGALFIDNPFANGDFVFRNGTGFSERFRINNAGEIVTPINTPITAGQFRVNGNSTTIFPMGWGFRFGGLSAYVDSVNIIDLTSSLATINGSITATGAIAASADQDGRHVFGRAVIQSFVTDNVYVSHFDHMNATNYALRQQPAGGTVLNSASGQLLQLAIGNVTTASLNNTQLIIGSNPALHGSLFGFDGSTTTAPINGGRGLSIYGRNNVIGGTLVAIGGEAFSSTSGSNELLRVSSLFAPSSGNANYTALRVAPTINQTGGATGITRAFFADTGFVSAFDYRAFDCSNSVGFAYHSSGTAPSRFGGNVGIGTIPTARFQVEANDNSTQGIFVRNLSDGTAASTDLTLSTLAGQSVALRSHSSTHTVWPNTSLLSTSQTGGLAINSSTTGPVSLWVNNAERVRATTTGTFFVSPILIGGPNGDGINTTPISFATPINVTTRFFGAGEGSRGFAFAHFQNGGNNNRLVMQQRAVTTYTDRFVFDFTDGTVGVGVVPVARLHVRGAGNTSSTFSLRIEDSDGANWLSARDDRMLNVTGSQSFNNGALISPSAGGDSVASSQFCGLRFRSVLNLSDPLSEFFFRNSNGSRSFTSSLGSLMEFSGAYAPTSGTGTYSVARVVGLINQTGGANGITQGVFVTATLTSAADWRSFDTNVNSGFAYHSSGNAPSRLGGTLQVGGATGPLIQSEAGGARLGLRNATNDAYITLGADQIWLGGSTFSRLGQRGAAGDIASGYNFNITGGTANRDSTGAVNGVWYSTTNTFWYVESSAAPGVITPRMTLSPTLLSVNGGITATGNINTTGVFRISNDIGMQRVSAGIMLFLADSEVRIQNSGATTWTPMRCGHITSSFQSLSSDPTTIDIPSGFHRRVKNTTSGEVRDWVNDGGIMRRSPAYT